MRFSVVEPVDDKRGHYTNIDKRVKFIFAWELIDAK